MGLRWSCEQGAPEAVLICPFAKPSSREFLQAMPSVRASLCSRQSRSPITSFRLMIQSIEKPRRGEPDLVSHPCRPLESKEDRRVNSRRRNWSVPTPVVKRLSSQPNELLLLLTDNPFVEAFDQVSSFTRYLPPTLDLFTSSDTSHDHRTTTGPLIIPQRFAAHLVAPFL